MELELLALLKSNIPPKDPTSRVEFLPSLRNVFISEKTDVLLPLHNIKYMYVDMTIYWIGGKYYFPWHSISGLSLEKVSEYRLTSMFSAIKRHVYHDGRAVRMFLVPFELIEKIFGVIKERNRLREEHLSDNETEEVYPTPIRNKLAAHSRPMRNRSIDEKANFLPYISKKRSRNPTEESSDGKKAK